MSIAWSVIEYLHDHCGSVPKVLFATHYHELTRLADELTHVMNLSMDVEESTEGIRFLHQVVKKASDRSYGVEVARLAGVPDIVVKRSEELLRQFEDPSGSSWNMVPSSSPVTSGSQLELFSAEKEGIIEELASIEPDEITPLKALEILYRLSARSREVSGK
jgi:DNA mismatch repair protein MutS